MHARRGLPVLLLGHRPALLYEAKGVRLYSFKKLRSLVVAFSGKEGYCIERTDVIKGL